MDISITTLLTVYLLHPNHESGLLLLAFQV